MKNDVLNELQKEREESKESLKKALEGLKGISPMSVITGQVNLDDLMCQIEKSVNLTDQLLSELVSRELNRAETVGG